MLKGKYNRIICLRNSTLVPAAQEVAALSGRELEAQSWEHCEFNVYYANFTAWSPSFPGEDLLNLLPASCALVTAENLLGPSQRMPIGHKMGKFCCISSVCFPSCQLFMVFLLFKKVYNPKSHPGLVYQENTEVWLTYIGS